MTSGAPTRATALFEQLGEPAVEVAFEGNTPIVESVNPAFEEVFDVTESEIVGESLDDVIVPPDRRDGANQINQRARAGEAVEREVRRRTPDGLRTFLFRSAPFRLDGEQRGYGIYLDITERKRHEQELERQIDRFEILTSMASHDLRNPLQIAQAYLQQARDDSDSEELRKVDSALGRIDSIIENMLTLMEVGKSIESFTRIDVTEISARCWQNTPTAEAELRIEDEFTFVGDPDRLEHVFENLFQNAVEHGGEDVTVRVGETTDGFYIEDDGSGIPEEEGDEIFEPGKTANPGGTGYGLAIVQEIVETHEWEVRVTDGRDGGARFEITGIDDVA